MLILIKATMIFLHIKRKKYRADIYELKLKNILSEFSEIKEYDEDIYLQGYGLYKKTYESLDYCFTQVLRVKDDKIQFQTTPNVLLAKGDIIRLCSGQKSPANLESINNDKLILNQGEMYQKKIDKTDDKKDDIELKEIFSDEIGFRRFRVLDTPIVNDIKHLFESIEKEKPNRNVVFDLQKKKLAKIINIILCITYAIIVALCLTWTIVQNVDFTEIFSHSIFIVIFSFYMEIPITMKLMDSISNAHMISLSECLQEHDYNKQFQINYYQFLQRNEKKKEKRNEMQNKEKNEKKKHKLRTSVKGFIKIDTFYEEFNFGFKGLKNKWSLFKKLLFEGVSRKEYNYVALLSSASVLAFIDCEGIVSENERYVNEIAMMDEKGKKVIIDLLHDPYVENEKDLYVFEKLADSYSHKSLKKSLAVAMGNCINPEFGNKFEFTKPIFDLPINIKEKVSKNSDEYFLSRFKKGEIIPHLD